MKKQAMNWTTLLLLLIGVYAPIHTVAAERGHHQLRSTTKDQAAFTYPQLPYRFFKQANDTVKKASRIVGIDLDASNDALTVRIELTENQSWTEISLYNMLGKRVKDIYRGPVSTDVPVRDFTVNISDLPNGLYIVSVQGSTIRLADKVFISR
ncbi:MAG: T9SS type A sorting domain-containing protein [Bacteroidota bacterium]|nr:T9SS type A sorting domain-containing protein [Candidatus Kapabacteria bacterium]MDW8270952.1 T9SS type A sorting domain-containing protein [Bacteroidota bacterium]